MRIHSHNHRQDRCHRPVPAPPTKAARERQPGFFGRLYVALMQGRQSEANRHIARLLSQSGGRLTDDMERRLSDRLIGNGNLRLD
jgi:hypothetical protein